MVGRAKLTTTSISTFSPKPSGGGTESATGKLLRQMHQAVFLTDKIGDRILAHEGRITLSQFLVLAAVDCCHEVNQQDIASHLSLTEAAVSRHSDILAGHGFLKRTTNARNRRAHILSLTNAGTRELKECKRLLQSKFEKAIAGMNTNTRRSLTEGLQFIINKLAHSEPLSN